MAAGGASRLITHPEDEPLLSHGGCANVHVVWATQPDWLWDVLGLLSIPALVALNAFFVAAEFSLVAVRRTRVEQMVLQGVKGARAVEGAVANITRYIAATQLGITLASI